MDCINGMVNRAGRRGLALSAALALHASACGDSGPGPTSSATETTTTTTPTEGDTETSTTVGPTTTETSATEPTGTATMGTMGTTGTTSPTTATTDTTTETTDTTTEPTTDSSTTGQPGGVCPLEQAVCDVADQNPGPYTDCGDLQVDDPNDAWVDAHDCVVDSVSNGVAFKLIYRLQGIDSAIGYGYAGLEGIVYQMADIYWDDFGVNDPPNGNAWLTFCSDIVVTPDCTPGTQSLCLMCEPDGEQTQICGE